MNRHMRAMLVTLTLALTATACGREARERESKQAAEEQAREAELTSAKMKSDAEEVAKTRAEHAGDKAKLQAKFDADERKATYLKQKAAKAVGKNKVNANAAMAELDARRTTAKTSLGRLTDEPGTAWDTGKKLASDDIDAYAKAVDALDHTLSK